MQKFREREGVSFYTGALTMNLVVGGGAAFACKTLFSVPFKLKSVPQNLKFPVHLFLVSAFNI